MTNNLLIWAVYRSLDNSTAPATSPAGNSSSDELLSRWQAEPPSDEQVLETLTRIYLHSVSLQCPGEPCIRLQGKFPLPGTKPQGHAPALWVDLVNPNPDLLKPKQPNLSGEQFLPIVRELLGHEHRPPVPSLRASAQV
jgi:hypothetical protein